MTTDEGRPPARRPGRSRIVPPVLVRQVRNGIEESVHRGDIVEVDVEGRLIRGLGDPDRLVTLRSCVKPFGVVALLEAGGVEAFDLEPAEIAIMASSHSGEDLHVRTIQAMYRRAGVSQTLIATGIEGMPLDQITAMRLARDGEQPGAIRHMCSGQHSVSILLSRLRGWDPTDYWREDHPSQAAYRDVVARAFGTTPDKLRTAIDGCGVQTYAFPLREVARAYAMLADPSSVPASDPRASVAEGLTVVRDAMLAHPEMVGGTRDRLDTSLMKAMPGRIVSKAGMEALARAGDPARDADVRAPNQPPPAWPSRSRTATATTAARGPRRSRRSSRPRWSTARRCGSSAATTGRRSSTRTDASAPRRSPASSWRRSGSSSGPAEPRARVAGTAVPAARRAGYDVPSRLGGPFRRLDAGARGKRWKLYASTGGSWPTGR